MTQRTERIDELLRQEIGELLSREVSDPRIGFVTVTRVETAPDLSHARIWVSLIGQKAERAAALTALRGAMPFIRHRLGDKIRIRRIPDLHLELDDTAERGTRVLQLLHELEEGRTPEETPLVGETLPTPTARIPVEGEEPVAPTAPAPVRKGPRRATGPAGRARPAGPRGQGPGGSSGRGGKGPGGSSGRGGKGPGGQRPAGDRRGSDRL